MGGYSPAEFHDLWLRCGYNQPSTGIRSIPDTFLGNRLASFPTCFDRAHFKQPGSLLPTFVTWHRRAVVFQTKRCQLLFKNLPGWAIGHGWRQATLVQFSPKPPCAQATSLPSLQLAFAGAEGPRGSNRPAAGMLTYLACPAVRRSAGGRHSSY